MKKGEAKRQRRNKGRHSKISKNALFRGENSFFPLEAKKGKEEPKKTKYKEGLGQVRWPFGPPHLTLKPSKKQKRRVQGQVRWPFGPPHLTLKPSNKNKQQKKQKKQKNINKKKKGKITRQTKKIPQKTSQLSVKIVFFGWGVQNFFFDNLPRKRAPPKHDKNRGFSTPIFEKQLCVTKRQFLDKSQVQKFQLSCLFGSFLLCQKQKHKNLLKPRFIVF